MKLLKQPWTLVRHSGHTKIGFERAVEEAAVTRAGDVEKIREAGGFVFDSYQDAAEAAMFENYPPEVTGLYPRARGEFRQMQIGGRRLYVRAHRAVTV